MAKLCRYLLVLFLGTFLLGTAMAFASSSTVLPDNHQTAHHHLPEGFVYLWQFYENQIKPNRTTAHLEPIREHLRYGMTFKCYFSYHNDTFLF